MLERDDFCWKRSNDYYTGKKENLIFLIYKEIQNEAVGKTGNHVGFC
jgi:hypothetical protein